MNENHRISGLNEDDLQFGYSVIVCAPYVVSKGRAACAASGIQQVLRDSGPSSDDVAIRGLGGLGFNGRYRQKEQ